MQKAFLSPHPVLQSRTQHVHVHTCMYHVHVFGTSDHCLENRVYMEHEHTCTYRVYTCSLPETLLNDSCVLQTCSDRLTCVHNHVLLHIHVNTCTHVNVHVVYNCVLLFKVTIHVYTHHHTSTNTDLHLQVGCMTSGWEGSGR